MNEAAARVVGRHDFTTFRSAQCQAKSPVKTLDEFRVERNGEEIRFHLAARSFLRNQVRSDPHRVRCFIRDRHDLAGPIKPVDPHRPGHLRLGKLPEGSGWAGVFGVAALSGIGFTMSLFVDSLAFTDGNLYQQADKLAVLIASFAAGIAGYLILRVAKYEKE